MDAERVGTLTGPELGGLIDALLDAYVGRDEFEMLLMLHLNKPPSTLSDDGALKVCVFKLVRAAKSEGWLLDLINAAIAERPGNPRLKAWVKSVGRSAAAQDPPRAQQLLDTTYFDLDKLRKTVAQATKAAKSQVLAFGVTYSDGVFIRKLSDWLGSYLGETQIKDSLNLRPELAEVSKRLGYIARYRDELKSANVLCVIYADGVPEETVADFWRGICRHFNGSGRYLVLIFTSHRDAIFPSGVTVLPTPQFEISDIDLWTHEMVGMRKWPMELANVWADMLRDESLDENVLDVRSLYEAMDRSIREVRLKSDSFRQMLEERIGHGYTSPA